MKVWKYGCFFGILLCFGHSLAFAQHHPDVETGELPTLKNSVQSLDVRLKQLERELQQPELSQVPEASSFWDKIEWALGVNGILQGNTNSGQIGGFPYDANTDGTVSIDLELLVPMNENGTFYALIEAGNGEGVDARIPTFSGFNADAPGETDFRLSEIWYQHQWFDGRLRGRVGKLDLTTDFDCNEFANDENTQFLSGAFVNNLAVEFPDYALGAMIWYSLTERLELGYAYAESDSDWNDLFDNGFHIAELLYHVYFAGRPGHFRVYGWYNGSEHSDFFGEREDLHNYGWGISWDQELTDRVGVFARWGMQQERVSEFGSAYSAGIHIHQPFCWRPDDIFGLAIGGAILGDDYKTCCETETADEFHLECYYRVQVTEYLQLTPDIQWVCNPSGDKNADDAFVLGLRGYLVL